MAFMTLPLELRKQIYEYIALTHTTRRVRTAYSENASTFTYQTATSSMTATCRLIHNEYEDVARKATTSVEFTATDMDFRHIVNYFRRQVDAKYLTILQLNKAKICVNMVVLNNPSFKSDMEAFYAWALFLIGIKLEAVYLATWMNIFEASDGNLAEKCLIGENSSQIVCDNIEGIRNAARVFDKARWLAYPKFRVELQARRRREWDRRAALQSGI